MPSDTGKFELADRLTGGKLAKILRDKRGNGASLSAVSRHLAREFDLAISNQTIANWCKDLGIEKPERVA